MCELVSATAMASAGLGSSALMVTDVLMAAGGLMGAMGQMQQGKYQQDMAEYNARVAENNAITQQRMADDAIARGAAAEDKHRAQVRQLIGKQRTAGGGMGIEIDSGSLGGLQDEAATLGEEDAWTIRTNAAREAWGHKVGAQNFQADATGSRLQGSLAARAGTMNAMGTLLTTGGSFAARGQGLTSNSSNAPGAASTVRRKWWED